MEFSTINSAGAAQKPRTQEYGRGLLECLEQLDAIIHQQKRAAQGKIHVSNLMRCPAFEAARVVEGESEPAPDGLIFNRDTDSKMIIGSWLHTGFQTWFLKLMGYINDLTADEIKALDLPEWLGEDLAKIVAECGEWSAEVPLELPDLGVVGTADLVRWPDQDRNILPAVIEIKTGAGIKLRDRAHYIQLTLYAAALFPENNPREVEMGIVQIRYYKRGRWQYQYWYEIAHPVDIDIAARVGQYVAAKKALQDGTCPSDDCFDPPEKDGEFEFNGWQCREPYCRCVLCPHWIPREHTGDV